MYNHETKGTKGNKTKALLKDVPQILALDQSSILKVFRSCQFNRQASLRYALFYCEFCIGKVKTNSHRKTACSKHR